MFSGVQATGKSTFYKERFFRTHVRINLDQLRTRRRERELFALCLRLGQPAVIDNTNPTRAARARYLGPARASGFTVRGFYFESRVRDALARNAARDPEDRVPERGVLGTYARLEVPDLAEGFDSLAYVRLRDGAFDVLPWEDSL